MNPPFTVTACLPIALDVGDHRWGRYEVYTYVHSPVTVVLFRSKSDEKHRPAAEHTSLDEAIQLFKVGVSPDLDRLVLNLTYSIRLLKL